MNEKKLDKLIELQTKTISSFINNRDPEDISLSKKEFFIILRLMLAAAK